MSKLIELRAMTTARAQAVFDRIEALDRQIFRFPTEEAAQRFYRGMRDVSVADKFVVFYEAAGEAVGFNLIKIQPLDVEDQRVWAVGSIAGFLAGHIGGNRTFPDAIRAMLRLKIRYPERTFYFVSMLINPGGYDLLVELCPETYPSPLRPHFSRFESALIEAGARASGAEILVDEPPRFIVSVDRSGQEPFVKRRETENIRYFEKLNPRYAEGHLLGVCAPLALPQLGRGALHLLSRRIKKQLGRRAS